MRLFRHFDETPAALRGGAVAIGNFDGLHKGHRAVIEAARAAGGSRNAPWGVMTFEPHPRAVFAPNSPPFRLTEMRVKARLIEAMGADFLLVQHFDLAFAANSATDFVTKVLLGGMGAAEVVVGQDFVFGKNRLGDAALLAQMARTHGFAATFVEPVLSEDGVTYSSSQVREALVAGRLDEVTRQLGRPWEIDGHVRRGEARGHALGYPTANLEFGELIRPAAGVYAVRAAIGDSDAWLPGVAYCGPRPTFDGHETLLETHLFDFSGDLYGKPMRVALIEFLRPDRRFADAAALARQMDEDARAARTRLAASMPDEASS